MLRRLWSSYEQQLASQPVRTQMATSLVLWGIGDYLAQRISHFEEQHYGEQNAKQPPQQSLQTIAQHGSANSSTSSIASSLSGSSSSSSSFQLDTKRLMQTAGFGAVFVGPVGK